MKKILLSVLLVGLYCSATAQAEQKLPPFWNSIVAFQKHDSLQAPPEKPIVLVGSSSFTIWQDVNTDFPGYPIVNRGFGGSTLTDVIRYADRVIIKYRPKQVLVYCGDNDLASSPTITADTVVERFKKLYGIIRKALPDTRIDYVSIKPSPSRENLLPKVKEANEKIQQFLSTDKNAGYIDVYTAMFDNNGKIKEVLFRKDRLHMKRNGYDLWKQIIGPHLLQ